MEGSGYRVYSQFGEDGLLQAAISDCGRGIDRSVVDVGASDGSTYSNSKLLRDYGWQALLIEQDRSHSGVLQEIQESESHTKVMRGGIWPDGDFRLEQCVGMAGLPNRFGVLSLDIDGHEYVVFESMCKTGFFPSVACVEFSPYAGDDNPYGSGPYGQAGFNPMSTIMRAFGYRIVARTYCNIIGIYDGL
jgi:hypothetical protein